ncbi:MAG TPA: alanine--glyoxylate aminotransferase family protein, partial [Gemmatimonadaceae bacterium]|nr:alanine--glyoxylate aminotransferase family protein [Gemmatimonadaceae bacterium]
MTTGTPFGTFFLPGPTEVHPSVLAAMTRPMIAHRGKDFEALFARLQQGMRDVFRTTRPILISSSSATGLMEASVRCAPPGGILAVVNGAFSERFAQIARACERDTDVLEVPLGRAVDPGELARRLAAKRYAAVTIVHSETSTGALSDVREATRLCREVGALCLVDSVTGAAGSPLLFDEWEMDFALTGSQKALALPPGLALGVASAAYMQSARAAHDRGLYFDLVEFEAYAAKNQTPNTPALPLFYALDVQLARIAKEGMKARWARHRAMAEQTWRWVDECASRTGLPLRVLAPEGERSLTVTAIVLPPGVTGPAMATAVRERGFVIGAGYGKLRETTFRIGHMGDHTPDRLALCLDACESA